MHFAYDLFFPGDSFDSFYLVKYFQGWCASMTIKLLLNPSCSISNPKVVFAAKGNLYHMLHGRDHTTLQAVKCSNHLCRHTPCHDPDWLADIEDMTKDATFYYHTWTSFYRSYPLGVFTAEERVELERRYRRCQRLTDKKDTIRAELAAYRTRRLKGNEERRIRNPSG
jgi:hypothetical protein